MKIPMVGSHNSFPFCKRQKVSEDVSCWKVSFQGVSRGISIFNLAPQKGQGFLPPVGCLTPAATRSYSHWFRGALCQCQAVPRFLAVPRCQTDVAVPRWVWRYSPGRLGDVKIPFLNWQIFSNVSQMLNGVWPIYLQNWVVLGVFM